MRNRGSGVKAALTHRSLTKENPIPHAQRDHIHPQNQSYRLPVLLQTVVISFSREDSARTKAHSFQYKPRDRPQSAPAFFQRSKKVQIVHPFCLFHSILLVLDFLPARPLWLGHRQQNSLFPSSAENHSRADARSNIRGRETFDTPVRQYLSYTKSDCFTRRKNHCILFYIVGLPCILDRE